MKKVFALFLLIGCTTKKEQLIRQRDEARKEALTYTKATTAHIDSNSKEALRLMKTEDSLFKRADSLQKEIDKLE